MPPTSADQGSAAPVVVVATITPLPEHREAVHAALAEAVVASHSEPGCSLYALHQAADRLVMIEQWDSQADLGAHAEGPVFASLGAAFEGRLAVPLDIVLLEAIPIGDAAKGAIRG